MTRLILLVCGVCGTPLVGVAQLADPASVATREAKEDPVARVLHSAVIVVGRVTAIEKEKVETGPRVVVLTDGRSPATPAKVTYTVANVVVEQRLLGQKNETHVKVGFDTGSGDVELIVGHSYLLHLVTKGDAGFYVTTWCSPAVPAKDNPGYEKAVAETKALTDALSDPVKVLKADKAELRATVAVALLVKYRSPPSDGRPTVEEKMSEEESRLVLSGLAEADWPKRSDIGIGFGNGDPSKAVWNGYTAFHLLGLTSADGWSPPVLAIATKTNAGYQDEFKKWLAGAGKDYRVKKLVAKDK